MYHYTQNNAKTYGTLGIRGTTYEPGFSQAEHIFGDLTGKAALDFGTGAGRTAALLHAFKADKVIGVDHNQAMVDQATATHSDGIVFVKIEDTLPFASKSFDVALAAHVCVEVGSLQTMRRIAAEIYRVLKTDGTFVIITNNDQAIGNNYLSFSYPRPSKPLVSGQKIPCTIKKGKDSFVIDDYYWLENDYRKILEEMGFNVSMSYPVMHGEDWLDETRVAPHVVIKSVKQ